MKKTRSQQLMAIVGAIALGAVAGTPALAQTQTNSGEMTMPGATSTPTTNTTTSANPTIVELAASNDSFNTLVQAVQAAGLADTLAGEGPYTVFAPTDEAFAALPEGALELLLQPENQDLLKQVLTYHVASGEIMANEITTGALDTLGGGLAVEIAENRVIVNNASVIQPNIQASNGVIHVINRVLLPPDVQEILAERLNMPQ